MKQPKLTKTQGIGLFVIITLVGLFLAINFLRGEDIFNKSIKYYTELENVEGLASTSPVYIKGLKVGMIKEIAYNAQKDNFIVEFVINSNYTIPSNSEAEMYSSDLLGGKSLRILMGDSNTAAKEKDTLKSATASDMMATLAKQIEPITENLNTVMTSLTQTLSNINTILDTNAQANISAALAHLNKTLKNAEGITGNIEKLSPEIKAILENFSKLSATLENSGSDISSALENLNSLTNQLSEAEIKATVESLKELSEKLQDPNGSIGKLLSTDALHNSVDSLVNNINTFVEKMTENPKKFIKISVF